MPDQGLATARQEAALLQAAVLQGLTPEGFEEALGMGLGRNLAGIQAEAGRGVVREAMTGWVVLQGTTRRLDILQCNPDTTHEAMGVAVEMNGITVNMLLAANSEIQGLEGEGFAPIEPA